MDLMECLLNDNFRALFFGFDMSEMLQIPTASNNCNGGERATSPKELFKKLHSALRNVIERSFGMLQKCFALLKGLVLNFLITTQVNVVIASCVVHNFLLDHQPHDEHFEKHWQQDFQGR
ncbi:hypothetical protein ACH5RR_001463 [Cinchona calisaya]|uniref:DDE Tnp4 domain-containing protein n=1 Tax=Cinchona calisaya TaxID=153742 RepID=A0ABD3B3G9_9GENT